MDRYVLTQGFFCAIINRNSCGESYGTHLRKTSLFRRCFLILCVIIYLQQVNLDRSKD
uniref:Uncharacterized protein n=1 Tax=Siphoviridae sp. ctGJ32 TaxID=2825409 RepID=A0A8S5TV47_9CAUD|nr:MAG TPA: hypothetical protein [Siphoviridae sp. ctGJ32]